MSEIKYCKCGIPRLPTSRFCFVCTDLSPKGRKEYQNEQKPIGLRKNVNKLKKETLKPSEVFGTPSSVVINALQDNSQKTCAPEYKEEVWETVWEGGMSGEEFAVMLQKPSNNWHWVLILGVVMLGIGILIYFGYG